jgi:hypothetical protein
VEATERAAACQWRVLTPEELNKISL